MPPVKATGVAARSSPKSDRASVRTCSTSSSTAREMIAFARRSPASATLLTTGASEAKTAGVACAAHAMSSRGSFTCAAVSTAPTSAVSGSRPSAAAVTTLNARRPIHAPLPSSPQIGPQPPQRAVAPEGPRPKAAEPVPLMRSTPGPSPNASSSAIVKSGRMRTSSASSSPTRASSRVSRSASRPAPATPTASILGSTSDMPDDANASFSAAAMTCAEWRAPPGRTALPGPTASPSCDPLSSAMMTRVLEPPPSTPATMKLMPMPEQRSAWDA